MNRFIKLPALAASLFSLSCGMQDSHESAQPAQTDDRAFALGIRAEIAGNSVLNREALLAGIQGKQWYRENIPFIEVPDAEIQQIYYYRWSVMKRNLKYTRPGTGYIFTEFLTPVGYAGIYGGIAINIWHDYLDGRWLRNRQYLDDDMTHWARGRGLERQYQYSNDLASAAYERYLVTRDRQFTVDLLNPLIDHFNGWTPERREGADIVKTGYDAGSGMYYANPDTEATEYSIASYQTNNAYKGGWGYRPSINAFMYGDMRAIANIASLAGRADVTNDFNGRANALKANVQTKLWDPNRQFFFQMMRNNATQEYGQHPDGRARNASLPIFPEGTLVDGRELMGYVPWMFNLPDDRADYAQAWRQIVDPQGFNTPFGPATAEQRHRLFNFEASAGCCKWDGPHWPLATSQALVGMGNLLHNYRNNTAVTKADYYAVLKKYTALQRKNGLPYVAEAADSLTGRWIYDSPNHSEHYNHSAYVDLVISGLLGVRPRADDAVDIHPLVPDTWDYFAIEDIPYHGRNLSVIWDRTGSRYGKGAGLQVLVDGNRVASQPGLARLTVNVGAAQVLPYAREVNLAANPFADFDKPMYDYPRASASFTSPYDNPQRAIDGSTWYDPANYGPNSRWTNFGSPNASDWLEVDFGRPTTVSQARLAFYDDTGTGSIKTPASYQVQYFDGANWVDVAAQQRRPATPTGNELNTVGFTAVTTTRLRAVLNRAGSSAVGLTEFEAYDLGGASSAAANLGLPLNSYRSLRVTTPGFTDRYARHANGLGATEVVNDASPAALKQDATFRIVRGLADGSCYSIESLNFPGQYLRHINSRVVKAPRDDSAAFDQDATWCARPGLAGNGVSFESQNFPGRYLRHAFSELWLARSGGPLPSDRTENFNQDTSWAIVNPWVRRSAALPGGNFSLQVVTPGMTDRFMRHQDALGLTEVVKLVSPDALKQSATLRAVPGLADGNCYSLQARNSPGSYLRHAGSRLRLDADDNTPLFKADATFCPQTGLGGSGVSLEAYNFAGFFVRHWNSELWLASGGGARPSDAATNFALDATWETVAPWAP
jgi:Alpha-L-arabinofuranosidase B (ABFB) domain/F5/8 type C domain